ncbi:AraC family transcriptional regulator [Opitutus sp. ER46]|uniref:helix-turn-helix transcriptional regulator n=1 Tax=Opitutus sp. ER46 TaxID=2161864 RepID=UPI000D2F91A7|nr:AraC family transcriptional regulator [Opitutus sp. ER46]PTX94491.1 hypothetical protein DB354_12160 [Opitutus sp. ER46]
MRRFRSLLIHEPAIRIPGLAVTAFALHRHLPEHASIQPHQHRYSQALLYLSSKGRQVLGETEAHVEPGTLILLPPGISHAFQASERRAPLCLMINFRLKGARRHPLAVCSLQRSALSQIRDDIARLMRLQATQGEAVHWEGAPIVLQTLLLCLRAAGWLATPMPAARRPSWAIRKLLEDVSLDGSLTEMVRRSGYQRDHLNRLVKEETGLSLGQFRARRRLERAKELLAGGHSVSATAAAVGLPDQAYFARWFRRQTGSKPSGWPGARARPE